MFAFLDLLNSQTFWIIVIVIAGLAWLTKEVTKTANDPWVQAGAKGIWNLFKK